MKTFQDTPRKNNYGCEWWKEAQLFSQWFSFCFLHVEWFRIGRWKRYPDL